MARAERPYVRVYYIDLERDYPQIWNDEAALGTWLRLLARADKMWPQTPELPRSMRRVQLDKLTTATLVELRPGHTFALKGYETERVKRQQVAKDAADKRWHSDSTSGRNAHAHASAMPNTESKTESESQRVAKAVGGTAARGTAVATAEADEAMPWLPVEPNGSKP